MPMLTPRRREAPPLVWRLFCQEHLGLSGREAHAWWQGLRRARWTNAVSVRSAVLTKTALPHSRQALETLIIGALSPHALVLTVEELWREHLLTRHQATRLQDAVLTKTSGEGQWR